MRSLLLKGLVPKSYSDKNRTKKDKLKAYDIVQFSSPLKEYSFAVTMQIIQISFWVCK